MTRLHHLFLLASLVALVGTGCPAESEPQGSNGSDTDDAETTDATDTADATDSEDDPPDTRDDEEETTDPNCHYDCFTHYTCEDGVVYFQQGGPIPCDIGGSELCDRGYEVGECEDGCRSDTFFPDPSGPDGWPIMCEENRPRAVGEPCASDDDCSPAETSADDSTDGPVEKELECDTDAGTCIDPNNPDYLSYCDADPDQLDGASGYLLPDGQISIPNCADGSYCYVTENADQSCQFCTIECESDATCPAGSSCVGRRGIMLGERDLIDICVPDATGSSESLIQCEAND